MIPKIIHYTWFSNDEMPQVVKDCMSSWKKILTGYEFRLWDMQSIESIESVFLKEAISVRKWAYAADYVRLYALYHEGGIYLDTDVMVYKSFDDLLNNKVFIGKENALNINPVDCKWAQYLTSHCMGAEPYAEYIRDCLRYFDGRSFILSDDEKLPLCLRYNYVILPYIQAVIAQGYGYKWNPKLQTIQHCDNGLTIYPSDFFCGYVFLDTSYCQHLALGSWRDKYNISTDIKSTSYIIKMKFKRIVRKFVFRFSYTIKKID